MIFLCIFVYKIYLYLQKKILFNILTPILSHSLPSRVNFSLSRNLKSTNEIQKFIQFYLNICQQILNFYIKKNIISILFINYNFYSVILY